MNRQIRRLGAGLLVLYLALFVQLNVVQVLRADDYNAHPENRRQIERDFDRPRGIVQSAEGVVLARSVPSEGRFALQREFPEGPLFAHVTGYYSLIYGAEGVERTYNDDLAGRTTTVRIRNLVDLLLDDDRTANVTLTIPHSVQRAAADALGDRRGAVVALDPRNGAVLALWSFPSFDPNVLSTHDQGAARQARDLLVAAPERPLTPRAFRETYFPGSTFKVVTAAAALEAGAASASEPVFPPETEYVPPLTNRPIRNFDGGTCGGNLIDIMRVSCNTAFAELGVEAGAGAMADAARAFGWASRPPLDLPGRAVSPYPEAGEFDQNTPILAQSAIGQNAVRATPLQMALMTAGVANGGQVMAPHVLAEVRDSEGDVVRTHEPEVWREAISETHAAILRDAMVAVVADGTAARLAIPGITVAGKTGTAQLGTTPPSSHAWIVGFAPAEAPRVAVAVIVEGQPGASEQTGGTVAAPIARAVMEAALAVTS